MKRRFTILTAALVLLAFLAIPMGMRGQELEDQLYSTCLFGPDYNSTTVSSYTATWTTTNGDFTWTIVNGNNNNNGWNYVKFGRKNVTSVGQITTNSPYALAITRVDLTIDAITADKINSIKLYTSSDNSTWTEVGSFTKAAGTQSVSVSNCAPNKYYKIEFDCASGSANGLVTVSKVEYYNLQGIDDYPVSTVTIDASNISNNDVYVSTEAGSLVAAVQIDGAPLADAPIIWSSSNEDVATIEAMEGEESIGIVTLVAAGTTTITAFYGGIEDVYMPALQTYELTVINSDPNVPGTENNPYTVAQARAAINAGTGTQGVYATGIVSAIPTAWSTQYNNITFNFVDNEGDTEFLQAYRCVSGDDVDASTVAVGDVVVVYGNLTKYGSTYEFGQGCQLVSLTHPVITDPVVTVTPATINAPAEETDGTLTITYENIEDLISFDYYFCDANGDELQEDPDWIYAEIQEEDDTYSLYYLIDANDGEARTAYLKVYTFDDNLEEVYAIVTVNQAEYVAPALDYATLPFEFDGGRNDIETTDGLTQEGLDSDYGSSPKLKFNTTGDWLLLHFNEQPGILTFNIKGNGFSGGTFTVQTSVDGETFTDLESYTELTGTTVYSEEFNTLAEDVRYIKWIYTEKSNGNVALGNITLGEYTGSVASITVNPALVDVDAEEHDGTLALAYENLEISDMNNFDIQYYDAEGEETTTPDWIEVLVAEQDPSEGEGYVVSYYMLENEGEARTAYFKVFALGDEDFVYSNLVTISQAAPVAPPTGDNYELFTGNLVEGDYLIVYDNGAMNNTVASDRLQYETITISNDVITTDNAAIIWHIAPSGDYWTIYSADANAYAASTGAKNKAQMLADGTDDKAMWTVSGTETYEFVNKQNTSNGVNANLRKNSTYGFACYATTTGGALSLYKKVTNTETYTLPIEGYADVNTKDHYYLIASPVGQVYPEAVGQMTDNNFDLYRYNPIANEISQTGCEWENWKAENTDNYHFNLEPGRGYLYANSEDVTLTFTGTPISGDEYEVGLAFDEHSNIGGWNLVGNPFDTTAYLATDLDFYTMNADGSDFALCEDNEIPAMQGIFVVATGDDQSVTFTTTDPGKTREGIMLNLSRNRGNVIDRAIVRVGEGHQLPKFMLNSDHTKLYIPQDNEDFAVVTSDAQGETPVSFKAAENGTYTLSVITENLDVNYLHLIDNMTHTDVDLLTNPSYSFEARTTDYANRFKLVYATGNAVEDNFAFFSDGNLIINNEGNATLQVVDITGRMISNTPISGCESINLNDMRAGVYMLRLVNGDNVKVQKVVVK